ncbi:uncharacterized protein LOC119998649 [Tripterygium wilfordii]|uniref:uncharacterized protein LOC119998649 n=1 Tax=Tripterygium wilfordii TaxID=458696 RepID=UPI0018F8293F|nr:uncharacterized protein LOC119998649 [Tripterygium wilfordii]
MEEVSILVRYCGSWEKVGLSYAYKGGKSKGMIIPNDISYNQLLDMVYELTNIDRRTHNIQLKYIFNVHGPTEPVEIEGDRDVHFFVRCNSDKNIPGTSLCISNTDREVYDDDTEVNFELNDDRYDIADTELFEEPDIVGFSRNIDDRNEPQINISEVNANDHTTAQENFSSEGNAGFAGSNSIGASQSCGNMISPVVHDDSYAVLKVGEIFPDKKSLFKKLCMHALHLHFEFKVAKSTKTLFVVRCKVSECKWWLRATRVDDTCFFVIKLYRDEHLSSSCFEFHEARQATGWVVGECIKSKYEGVSCIYKPNDIVKDFQRVHGVSITYGKAWRARESALHSLHGTPEQSFAELPSFFAQLESNNPGTVTHIELDSINRLKYCFMAIGPSLRGFRTCIRPVICVDGTHLKGKYLGTLFVATCLDGNNQVYPLAFGVGDSENDDAWTWFFEKLNGAIESMDSLVFISDRNASIEKSIRRVFPEAIHGACMYHLGQNLKSKKFSDSVIPLFYKAPKSYNKVEFHHIMNQILRFDAGNVFKYLSEAGFEKWSRAYFPGQRRSIALEMKGELTDYYDKVAEERRNRARVMTVEPFSINTFLVKDGDDGGQVDLASKTCSCRVFDIDHIPCIHAFAACRVRKLPIISLCSQYYRTDMLLLAYAEPINPVLNTDANVLTEELRVVLPPETRRKSGRPKKRRIPSSGEQIQKRKCSRCKQDGHNRQTCSEPICLHPSTSAQ